MASEPVAMRMRFGVDLHDNRTDSPYRSHDPHAGRTLPLTARGEKLMAKNPNLTLTGSDLAALLCSRVCHDVISPVGVKNEGFALSFSPRAVSGGVRPVCGARSAERRVGN
eukprot:gene65386-89439_t